MKKYLLRKKVLRRDAAASNRNTFFIGKLENCELICPKELHCGEIGVCYIGWQKEGFISCGKALLAS